MIVENCIDSSLFPLKSSDKVDFAIETLLVMGVSALPVVDDEQILGFVDSSSLENATTKGNIKNLIKLNIGWMVNGQYHYDEAIKRFSEFNAGCLAVIDSENAFKGISDLRPF